MGKDIPDLMYNCRSGNRCINHTSDGSAVTVKQETLCAGCVDYIQKCLSDLPHLCEALKSFLGGSMKVAYQSKVKATKEPAAPLNVMVCAALGDVEEIVDRAGGYQVQIKDLITRPAELFIVWEGHGEYQQKRYLDGVQRALAVRQIHDRIKNMVGLEEKPQRRHAPCPQCQLPCLMQFNGSGLIRCSSCGQSMNISEYESYVKELKC